MNKAHLLIGGNLGDRKASLKEAADYIEQYCGTISKRSSIYETEPWGMHDQPTFYNQALELQTPLSVKKLMQTLLEVEEQMGRKRLEKMGPRNIDIDILLFNNAVVQSEVVTVPHPRLTERRFALIPLAEIAASVVHPSLQKTIEELVKECVDKLDVHKIYTTE